MDTGVRSESWSNLRSMSVKLKSPRVPHTADDVRCDYLQDVFETSRNDAEGKDWDPDLLSFKSYSISALTQKSTVRRSNPCSADTTPQTRRKSVKRIIERFSNHNSNSNINSEKLTAPSNHRKISKNHKRDSVYFNLYMEAVEQSLLSEEDLKVWKIQEHFPNDDLKFYEGIFSINTEDKETSQTKFNPYCVASATLGSGLAHFTVVMGLSDVPTKNEDFKDDEVHLKPQAVKIKTIEADRIYDSKDFPTNRRQRKEQTTSDFLSQLPTFSNLSPGLQAKFKKMAQRRQSAPSIVLRNVLGKPGKLPASLYGREDNTPYSPSLNSQRLSLKFGSHGATLNLSKRKYIMEGKVQLTTGMQTQDRYMFLFTDLLLIAKAKSGSNFKLKYRIRVCELWIASCLDDVCEIQKSSDQSFVIGWPTANCVATFGTPESKERWLKALLQQVEEEKEKETPKTTTLRVTCRDSSNINQVKSVTVSHKHTAKEVVEIAVKEFNFENKDDQYQLWVTSRKEATAYPLIGHENPHAIQISQIRDVISANGILPETEITSVARFENLIQSDDRHRCQFILRSSRQSPNKFNADMSQRRMARIKAKTPAAFFNWARKRNGQRNESSDSGHASMSGNSAGSDVTTYFSSSPPSTSPPATPKLFSLPLGQVCQNGELPGPITLMIDILYRKAPYTNGIFRKSANAKTTRQIKHKLDDESDVTINDASIHVVAALFKDFLRNIPDSVLDSSLYTEWTAASDLETDEEKINTFRNLLRNLDECNRVLMRRLAIVLSRIASRAKCNNMTSYNLAVCIAPSLLWPPGPALQADAPIKVTQILQFLTDRCTEIFDGLVPTDMNWPPDIELKSESDEYEGDNEKSTGTIDEPLSPVSDIVTSQDNDLEDNEEKEEDERDIDHFSRSRMIRRQLQRRKPGSKVDAARRMSLSQDSLDRVLNDESLTSNVETLDDIILTGDLHPHRTRRRGHHRGTDACSMSNDSGFTTLSGEDEDERTSRNHPNILMSLSTGSNLNELEENIRRTSEELRNLWDPNLLRISNGEIIEEDEYIDEEAGGKYQEETPQRPSFVRRQSQPVLSRRQRLHALSVNSRAAQNRRFHINGASSRLVEAITSPSIEFDESDDEEFNATQFRRQPPTYVRLNDNKENEPEKTDGLAQEYLNKLRKLSTDDVTETIAKSVTSAENKKQYLSGVTVKVNDVRPVEQKQYRPVTLSLCGINTNPVISLPELDESSAIQETNTFYIEEDSSTGSTPDALSSSQEDVFKNYDFTPVRNRSSSDIPEAPKTAPLSRKFNSARSHDTRGAKVTSPLTPQLRDKTSEQCLSPIRKLTENLNMIPDFRQKSRNGQKSVSEFNNSLSGRKKASSVREGRQHNHHKNDYSAHIIKAKKQNNRIKSDDVLGIIGTSFKAEPIMTSSKSSISDASKSSIESSSKSSLKEESQTPKQDVSFDRDIRARRPYSRRRQNLLTKMTRNAEEGSFAKSLPTGDWNKMKDSEHMNHEEESSRESLKSPSLTSNGSDVIYSDVISRLNQPSPKLKETDIMHMAGAVESKIRELSNSSPSPDSKENTSNPQIHISPGSVKSKITAFNGLTTPSPKSHSSNSSIEDLLTKRRSGASPQLDAPAKVGLLATQRDHDVMKKRSIDVGQNGLVIRGSQEHRNINQNRLKESLSVQIHPSDNEKPIMTSVRRSPQSVSDNLIFSLSESFAFGNRRSPRSITPNASPHESPVFHRRRRNTEKRNPGPKLFTSPQNITPIRRTRHMSVERYTTPSNHRTNVHVTALSSRRKKNDDVDVVTSHTNGGVRVSLKNHRKPPPSPAVTTRDRNSNEILTFAGLERVNHSEESYV